MADYEGTCKSVTALSDDELDEALAGLEDQMRRMTLVRDTIEQFYPFGACALHKLTDQLLLHCREATKRETQRHLAGNTVATRPARQVSDGHGGIRGIAANERPCERSGHSGIRPATDSTRQPDRPVVSTAVLSGNSTAIDTTAKTAALLRSHDFTFECTSPGRRTENGSGLRVPLPPPPATPPVRRPAERLHLENGAGQARDQKENKNRGVKRVKKEENEDDHLKTHHKEKRRKLQDNASKADKHSRRQGEQTADGQRSRPALASGRRTHANREHRILAWRAGVASAAAVKPLSAPEDPSSPVLGSAPAL